MDFINSANKQVDKFGSGKHGFSAGNPSGGIPATYLTPAWCDNIQQEIVNVIEGAGIAINPGSQTQLYQAIQAIMAGATGNDYKASVRAATVGANITLAGGAPNTLDGVTLVANDRILVKDQTTGSQNGIYVVTTLGTGANGTWTRATDADQAGELTSGAIVAVEEGTANADSQWMLTTDGTITIGTTALTFVRKDGVTYASNAEAQAFVVTNKAITPASLAAALQGANQSMAASGYQKLPGGLIIQWGAIPSVGSGITVTFPLAFPNAAYSVAVSANTGTSGVGLSAQSIGLTSFVAVYPGSNLSSGGSYIAIGR